MIRPLTPPRSAARRALLMAAAAAGAALAPFSPAGAAPAADAAAAATVPATVPVKRKPSDAQWKEYPVRTVAQLPGFAAPAAAEPGLDRFGGRTDRTAKATGFFRVEKQGDRWWLVDPDGGLFVHVGVVALSPKSSPAFQAAFPTVADWQKKTGDLLGDNGFNGAGCWSDAPALRGFPEGHKPVYTVLGDTGIKGAPYAGGVIQEFGKKIAVAKPGTGHFDYANDCIPVFHPDFPAFCDDYAKTMGALKDDPWLLGYYSDNELPQPRLKKYLALPPADPVMGSSYQAARAWWDSRAGKKDAPAEAVTDADDDAWAEYVFDRYFQLTTAAFRKYDPNHLCLGSRINLGTRCPGAYRAAGKYLDAIAVNLYHEWDPQGAVHKIVGWAGKPVIITEFYAKAMDAGLANTGGAGWVVPTQRDRGLFYQTFVLGLLQSKECVGWHWFKYLDNDPSDKNADPSNRDSNKGIVSGSYVPYTAVLDLMRPVNKEVYALTDYFDRQN